MEPFEDVIHRLVQDSKELFRENLVGVYLHGSAVMGCFHPETSDLDFLVVVQNPPTKEEKRAYLDRLVALNQQAPAKGIELSLLLEGVCKPFRYPTPFECHFSAAHLSWYTADPEEYVEKMQGTDKDLAAHVTILYHRGKTLFGKEIREVFGAVPPADYFDSIWYDVEQAKEEITANPTYVVLNLCRVLAYRKEGKILSKQEGGDWGLSRLSPRYRPLIQNALTAYQTGKAAVPDEALAREFAGEMLKAIRE